MGAFALAIGTGESVGRVLSFWTQGDRSIKLATQANKCCRKCWCKVREEEQRRNNTSGR